MTEALASGKGPALAMDQDRGWQGWVSSRKLNVRDLLHCFRSCPLAPKGQSCVQHPPKLEPFLFDPISGHPIAVSRTVFVVPSQA